MEASFLGLHSHELRLRFLGAFRRAGVPRETGSCLEQLRYHPHPNRQGGIQKLGGFISSPGNKDYRFWGIISGRPMRRTPPHEAQRVTRENNKEFE